MKLLKLLICSSLIVGPVSMAQICNQNIVTESANGRFINNNDGTITDVIYNKTWKACSEGQTYSEGQCLGSPSEYSTWGIALQHSSQDADYRLPNIKELQTLVQHQCIEPAIDLIAFPDTPLAIYWSSTPEQSGQRTKGRIIDFTDGFETVRDVNKQRFVRLIKR